MDAIEILGGLLGRKTGGGSLGGKILKDILGGGGGSNIPSPEPSRQPRSNPNSNSRDYRPNDLDGQARELEDLLNVANNRRPQKTTSNSQTTPIDNRNSNRPNDPFQQRHSPPPSYSPPAERCPPSTQNDQAIFLIRAMINASKADGSVTRDEQQAIIEQVGDQSPETVRFLQQEFQRELDVREFAWSIPLGLEQKVYSMSLIGMNLDSNQEAQYLGELAHGLRLPPELCNQIHDRMGAPKIFTT